VVRAPHLSYTDDDRVAVYTGGVILDHSGTHVTSTDLRAILADANADSRLEKAFADGNVVIHWVNPSRTRVGSSQHAEYYTSDQRVFMTGGRPKFDDSCKGSTEGNELTYFANDDRLLVNGKSGQPSQSRINRACK
jgi:lipopolysaccharide export system protein LptA